MTELRVLQYRTSHREIIDSSSSPSDKALRLVDVATVLTNESGLKFLKGTKYDIWPSKYIIIFLHVTSCKKLILLCLGYTPIDGVPDTKIKIIILPVTVVLVILNACGIVFGIICLMFIIYFRNKK